jgi:hypothetical protein
MQLTRNPHSRTAKNEIIVNRHKSIKSCHGEKRVDSMAIPVSSTQDTGTVAAFKFFGSCSERPTRSHVLCRVRIGFADRSNPGNDEVLTPLQDLIKYVQKPAAAVPWPSAVPVLRNSPGSRVSKRSNAVTTSVLHQMISLFRFRACRLLFPHQPGADTSSEVTG